MSLPPSIWQHEGQLVCFWPRYGWGWYRLGVADEDRSLNYDEIETAGVFHIRVHRIFLFEGEPRGIVGRVEQVGHLFDNLWAAMWTMLVGEYDISERLCQRWDIELGPTEPPFKDGWPVTPEAPPAFGGYGVLAESLKAFSEFRERSY